jgi:hypothetical protein
VAATPPPPTHPGTPPSNPTDPRRVDPARGIHRHCPPGRAHPRAPRGRPDRPPPATTGPCSSASPPLVAEAPRVPRDTGMPTPERSGMPRATRHAHVSFVRTIASGCATILCVRQPNGGVALTTKPSGSMKVTHERVARRSPAWRQPHRAVGQAAPSREQRPVHARPGGARLGTAPQGRVPAAPPRVARTSARAPERRSFTPPTSTRHRRAPDQPAGVIGGRAVSRPAARSPGRSRPGSRRRSERARAPPALRAGRRPPTAPVRRGPEPPPPTPRSPLR